MATRQHDLEPASKPGRRITPAQIGFIIALCLMIAFAVANLDEVRVNWLLGTWSTPLIIALAVSFLLGAGAGALAMRQRTKRKAPERQARR